MSPKLKSQFNQMYEEKVTALDELIVRCISCDLHNPEYPFKRDDRQFELNEQQKEVVEGLYKEIMIKDDDRTSQESMVPDFFLIEGYAGTGKTTVVTDLVKYPELNFLKICFSAPTNIALNVLYDKMTSHESDELDLSMIAGDSSDSSDSSNSSDNEDNKSKAPDFLTVFKLMGSKFSVNQYGDEVFDSSDSAGNKFSKYDLIFIDEVSMVTKKQIDQIISIIKMIRKKNKFSMKKTRVPKVVFLGDDGQLPPVKEESSIIFDPQIQFDHRVKKYVLSEIMRSRDQARVTAFSQKIRTLIPMDLQKMKDKDLPWIDLNEWAKSSPGQVQQFKNKDLLIDDYVNNFNQSLRINEKSMVPVILAYTNNECDSLNETCRNLIFDYPDEKYVQNELLVFTQYHSLKRLKYVDKSKKAKKPYYLKFCTSKQIIINNVELDTIEIDTLNYHKVLKSPQEFINQLEKKLNQLKVPVQKKDFYASEMRHMVSNWKITETKISTGDMLLDRYLNRLINLIGKIDHKYDIYRLFINDHEDIDPLDTDRDNCYLKVISDTCNDRHQANLDQIRTHLRSVYKILIGKFDWSRNPVKKFVIDQLFQQVWLNYYYITYRWPFAEMTYGYAMTTHKSQGSTYNVVYVIIPNILGCRKVNAMVRMKSLYTAVTRTAKTINIFYNKNSLTMLYPLRDFHCQECGYAVASYEFPSVNCTVDRTCANRILAKARPMTIYKTKNPSEIVLVDKNKNAYLIPKAELEDVDLNDAFHYISEHGLKRSVVDRYQQSNLNLIKRIGSPMT